MRLIDADVMPSVKFHALPYTHITPSDVNAESYKRGWNDAIDAIVDCAPTIDAVHVVRCWECELWNEWDYSGHKELGNFVCSCAHWTNEDGYVVYTKPDDFCSYGERKDCTE